MATKRKPDQNALIGFIIAEPIRGALAEVFLDAPSPPTERALVQAASTILKQANWKAAKAEIRHQLARLHVAGLAEPVVVDGKLGYRLTDTGRSVVAKTLGSSC